MEANYPGKAHNAWRSLRQTFPIRKSEWICAVVLFCCSAVLLLNTTLFEREGYAAMARFAPQWIWQWALFAVGSVRLAVLGINGAYWRSPHWRAGLAFASCFAWWQITIGLVGNLGLGFVLAAGWIILDAFNFKQALTEAFASEALREAERRNDAAAQH